MDPHSCHCSLFVLLGVLIIGLLPTSLPLGSSAWGEPRVRGTLWAWDLNELSGMAPADPGGTLFWGHNDSGDAARLFLFGASGEVRARVPIRGMEFYDAEDMAAGPCEPGSQARCLFVGDIGDNHHRSHYILIVRIPLPDLSAGVPASLDWDHRFLLTYPEGAHDAEALTVHPHTGAMHIIQKTRSGDSQIFEVPASAFRAHKRAQALRHVATVHVPHEALAGRLITSADWSPQGDCLSLRTYLNIHTFCSDAPATLEDVLANPVAITRPPMTLQSEVLTHSPDGRLLYTSSERWPAPLITLHAKKGR